MFEVLIFTWQFTCYLLKWIKDSDIKCSFCPMSPPQLVDLKKNARQKGVIFETIILGTHTPILSWKMQFCPISPLQVGGFEEFLDKRGSFLRQMFWVLTSLCYLHKCSFCPISPLPSSWIWKIPEKNCILGPGPPPPRPSLRQTDGQLIWVMGPLSQEAN